MSIRIIKQGLFDTVQDLGRYGYQHLGINAGGAMDTVAASLANMLVGNETTEAVIEMHFPGPVIYFDKAAVIALTGADFSPSINNTIVPLNTTLIVAASSTLLFKKYVRGARIYLSVQGGFSIEPWLNSYSTNTKAAAGGFHGRGFKKNDVLHCKAEQLAYENLPALSVIQTSVSVTTEHLYNTTNIIRCITGKDFEALTNESRESFVNPSFNITMQSDRMGYRLQGNKLECTNKTERISAAVTRGSIQLLPHGQLIVLMADHQTTGGYPVIAHVVSADISTLAQMQPGSLLQFQLVDIATAEELYMQQQQYLQQIAQHCNLQLTQFFS
jgi:antagonist of KipI